MEVVGHADTLLEPAAFDDFPGAVNGLQFENRGTVTRIAAAVDATPAVVRKAVDGGADLLIVHHGLFWRPTTPWTGRRAAFLRLLIESDLAVYSQHLPLDGHPRLGNAAGLAAALGWRRHKPFFHHKGRTIGVQITLNRPLDRHEVAARLTHAVRRPPILLPGGSSICRRIGICTGGAGSELVRAAEEGVDTFITGEGPHWTHALAEETGINVFHAGHYATEVYGVQALAGALARRFELPWFFVDHPSGL